MMLVLFTRYQVQFKNTCAILGLAENKTRIKREFRSLLLPKLLRLSSRNNLRFEKRSQQGKETSYINSKQNHGENTCTFQNNVFHMQQVIMNLPQQLRTIDARSNSSSESITFTQSKIRICLHPLRNTVTTKRKKKKKEQL